MEASYNPPQQRQTRVNKPILASKWCPIVVGFNFFLAMAWAIVSFTYLDNTTSAMKELSDNSGSTSHFYPLLALGLASTLFFFIGVNVSLPRGKESPASKNSKLSNYFATAFFLASSLLSIIYIIKGWSPLISGTDRFQNFSDINPAVRFISGQLISLPIILGALYASTKNKIFLASVFSGIVFLMVSGEKFSGLIAYIGALTIGLISAGLTTKDIPKKKILIAVVSIFTISIFLGYQQKDSAYDAAEERFLIMQGQVWWEVSNTDTSMGQLESIETWMGNTIPVSMYEDYASRGVVLSMGGVPLIYRNDPMFSFIIVPTISAVLGIMLGIAVQLLKKKKYISALLIFKSYIYLNSIFLMGEFSEMESLKFAIYLLIPVIPIIIHIKKIKFRTLIPKNRGPLVRKI